MEAGGSSGGSGDGGSFLGFWEPQAFLYEAIFLSLFLCLARKVQVPQGIRNWAAGEETGGSQDVAVGPPQDGISQRTGKSSIRHLLCDDMKCALCAQVAEEASKKVCLPLGSGPQVNTSPKPLEYSSWLGLSLPTGQDNFPQSFSEPAPISGHRRLPLRAASTGHQADSPSENQEPRFPPSRGEEGLPCSAERTWSKVTLCSSFSSISGFSVSSRTEGSSSSALSQGLFRAVVLQEEACEYGSQTESDVSSGRRGPKGAFPETSRHFPSTRQEAAPERHDEQHRKKEEPTSPGTSKSQKVGFGAVEAPFAAEATRESLERHVLAKRIQHEMGLPLAVLRSLRALIPLAPAFTSGPPARSSAAAPRPQALPFLREDSTRELEQHLRKMVRLQRWGLPQRVQEALRHMRPPGGSAFPADPRPEKACQTVPSGQDMALQPAPLFQPQFPAPLQMAGGDGRSCDLQPSSSLMFQSQADNVELRSKYRPFRAVPPTQVISKAPAVPLEKRPIPEGGHTQLAAPTDLERLEHHILRKGLQHHWGLPSLARRSLRHFLPAAPPLPLPCQPCQPNVKVFLGADRLRLVPPEAQRQLDDHTGSLVLERRWGPPKRALQSLRTFMPGAPPQTRAPKEREKGRVSPKVKRCPSAKAPRPSKRRADWPEGDPARSSWPQKYRAVQRHLAKKALEIQLGLFCPVVQCSQDALSRGRKRALPKLAPPGPGVMQPRCQEVPFVEQDRLDHIKLNIIHKSLACRWGLPTLYRKSLARLCHSTAPPALRSLPPTKAAGVDFSAAETPFVGKRAREELEWHVRRKQLQHTWGLPGLAQRSLRHLLPATPLLLPHQRIRHEKVVVSQQRLPFLSKETEQKLDLNVRKRVILQHWGLPRVVLRSLRGLCPEKELPPLGRRATNSYIAPPRGSSPCRPRGIRTFPRALADNSQARGRVPAAPHQAPACPMARPKYPAKLIRHVARKSVEVRLGILPPAARQSWRLASLSQRQPLPRLIQRSQGALRPRRSFLPFVRMEDMDRIEVAISRNHLASLWGLGLRYGEALAGMVPKPCPSLLRPRHPGTEFQEMPTPFFPQQDREALELSIQKKRLQHVWGLPALIQKSLKALVEGLPMLPARSGAGVQVNILPQEPSFLPGSTLSHLELHVQKMKLHHQWGLPRRVLQYLQVLCPQAGSHISGQQVARAPLAPAPCSHGLYPASSAAGTFGSGDRQAPRAQWGPAAATPGHSPQRFILGPRILGKLRLHWAKKGMEVRLGAFPALARSSWVQVASQDRLPKWRLHSRNLQPRSHFLPFVRREDVEQIELAVRRNHLRVLWGLGPLGVEAVAAMVPTLIPRPLTPSTGAFVFSEAKTPFLPEQDREALELLVKRRRLQHMWGLPGLIQRALSAFMREAPSAPACPKTTILVQTHGWELPFLPRGPCRTLESHLQKMRIQRQWGLPSRVLKSVKMFLPSDGRVGSDRGPQRRAPPPDRGFPSTERSISPGSQPHKEEVPPSRVVPERSSVPRPALHVHLDAKGSKALPVGKGEAPRGATQLPGKGREEQASPLPLLLRRGAGPSAPKKSISRKLSLIGSILEKKLSLDHGLHTWLQDQERQRALGREMDGKGGLRGADRSVLQRWEEGQGGRRQGAGSTILAGEKKVRGLSPAHPPKLQPWQAGRMKPLARPEGESVGSASGKPSRGSAKGKSRSLAVERIYSRERGRGTTPVAKGETPGSGSRERREQRPSSKEGRLSSKERSSAIKQWQLSSKEPMLSAKEHRPGSKERRLSSKEQRPSSKEQRPGSKEQTLSSKDQTLGNKQQRPDSKERLSSSKEQRPGSEEQRSRSKERRSRSKERRSSSTKHR